MEKTTRNQVKQAVNELKDGLIKLNNPSFNNIDKLMRKIMKEYDLTAKELHYGFRDLNNNKTPDEWIKGEKKMKTFKEFIEEAYLIQEMRKEDKVKGKKKTPMYLSLTNKKAEKTPEGKWEIKKTEYKRPNPDAMVGRMRQGMTASPEDAPAPSGWGSEREQLRRHPHGGGRAIAGVDRLPGAKTRKPPQAGAGELRGKKKVPGAKRERDWQTEGPSPQQKVEWAKAKRSSRVGNGLSYTKGF